MTKLETFLIEFGEWWASTEEPTVQKFCAYKVGKGEIDDLASNQRNILAIAKLLNG
tara:strand:+ start:688 stop:855 length:168 start_codon:yes stop_codon:yes gene_type:complete